jgi:hypothetical protein
VGTAAKDDTAALQREFEREIVDYLRFRPDQIDDLDGVLYWWLFHRRYVRHTDLVELALARLVEEGWVARIDRPDASALFGAGTRLKAEMLGPPGPDA